MGRGGWTGGSGDGCPPQGLRTPGERQHTSGAGGACAGSPSGGSLPSPLAGPLQGRPVATEVTIAPCAAGPVIRGSPGTAGGHVLSHPRRTVVPVSTSTDIRPTRGRFRVVSEFEPSGDQPTAIKALAERVNAGETDTVLLGATGTGK
jgi:hypothetical protein